MTAAAGEVLALGDLCGRNIAAKVDKPYQNGKKNTESDGCTEENHSHQGGGGARLEGILAGISFD